MAFDISKMSNEEAKGVLQTLNNAFNANIALQQSGSSQEVGEVVIDLSTAKDINDPLEISYPFISLRVEEATDSVASVRCKINTRDDFQKNILLKLNDTLEVDRGVRKAYLYWTAQPNKKMIIKFFTTARVRSGTLVLDQGSQNSTFTIGYASAQNDGLTLVLSTRTGNSGTLPTNVSGGRLYPLFTNQNQFSLFNGFMYVAAYGGGGDILRVPDGYQLEILGCEYIVQTAVTSLDFAMQIFEVADATPSENYAINLIPSTYFVTGFEFITAAGLAVNLTPTKLQLEKGASGVNPTRKNAIINGGKCVSVRIVNFDVTNNAGKVVFNILARLTKKVGA